MRLLLDTNVVLDYFGVNEGFGEDAENIIGFAIVGDAIELVSASAITDIYYTAKRRLKSGEKAISLIRELRRYVLTLPVTDADIERAINRNWRDFEDAVQYSVAESNHVDIIITRNKKDFEEQSIPCMTPKEFIAFYETQAAE